MVHTPIFYFLLEPYNSFVMNRAKYKLFTHSLHICFSGFFVNKTFFEPDISNESVYLVHNTSRKDFFMNLTNPQNN